MPDNFKDKTAKDYFLLFITPQKLEYKLEP